MHHLPSPNQPVPVLGLASCPFGPRMASGTVVLGTEGVINRDPDLLLQERTITVLLGAHNVEIGELGRQEVWVHHRILHPEFNDETDEKDLMLLQEVELKIMGKGVCLPQPYPHYALSRMLCGGDPQKRKASFPDPGDVVYPEPSVTRPISDPRDRHVVSFPRRLLTMLLLLLFPMVFPLPPGAQAGEIIGGQEAQPHSRPYMAFVRIQREGKGGNMCGGFLIREDVMVTAAHCNCNLGNISVLLGAHNFEIDELGTQKIWVRRRIPHPEFNDETLENDLMLLQLMDKAKLTQTVGTIPLSQKKVKKGAVCSVAGWGQTSSKTNSQPSPDPAGGGTDGHGQENVSVSALSALCPIQDAVRGGPQERKSPFLGDSGGPLVCDGKARGIVSHGSGDWSTPSVFTRLSIYVPWIKKTLCKLKP
ncbi:unnamed protein product [Caretta caretta]